MFWTLTPSAIRSKTAIASPRSPAQASTRAPPTVSRAYLAVAWSAGRRAGRRHDRPIVPSPTSLDPDDAESPNERGAERATRGIGETQDEPRGRGVLLRPIVPSRTRPQGAAEAHGAGLAHGGYQRERRRDPAAARLVELRKVRAERPTPGLECGKIGRASCR